MDAQRRGERKIWGTVVSGFVLTALWGILFRHQSWAELFPQLVITAVSGGVVGYMFLASTSPIDSSNS
jgi:hypothetical protein